MNNPFDVQLTWKQSGRLWPLQSTSLVCCLYIVESRYGPTCSERGPRIHSVHSGEKSLRSVRTKKRRNCVFERRATSSSEFHGLPVSVPMERLNRTVDAKLIRVDLILHLLPTFDRSVLTLASYPQHRSPCVRDSGVQQSSVHRHEKCSPDICSHTRKYNSL